ncbi:MAG: RcnB family protein [Comamonas sp.]
MQLHRITSYGLLAAALTLGVTSLAQAQPHGHRHGPPPHAHGGGPKHHPGWRPGPPPRVHHHPGYRPPPPPVVIHHYRGAGPRHNWYKGSRLPPQYRLARYVVHDWRGHRLHQPPRGYQWVQYGGDYMLVAIASGVIAQLIVNGLR